MGNDWIKLYLFLRIYLLSILKLNRAPITCIINTSHILNLMEFTRAFIRTVCTFQAHYIFKNQLIISKTLLTYNYLLISQGFDH